MFLAKKLLRDFPPWKNVIFSVKSISAGIKMLPKVILIACGSFSPPTPMHFRMFGEFSCEFSFFDVLNPLIDQTFPSAEIARDYFQQMGTHEVVGGIVSPVHDSYGKKGLVVAKHRIAMLKLALKSSEWIRMSDWETQQDGWTRTRITLQYHQNYINSLLSDDNNRDTVPSWLPGNLKQMTGTVQVKLLCGADLLESWNVPGLWENDDVSPHKSSWLCLPLSLLRNYDTIISGEVNAQFLIHSRIFRSPCKTLKGLQENAKLNE